MQDIEVLSELARGDHRVVHEAHDYSMRRDVAIISLRDEFSNDPKLREDLFEQARFVETLRHPGFLRILTLDEVRGWVVADRMHGSVQDLISKGPVSPERVRTILRQALDALEYLHAERKCLYSGLRPSKLLFNEKRLQLGLFHGQPITDLRAIRVPEDPKYIAPEIIDPKFGAIGPQLDIYCLGFIALEALVGPGFNKFFPVVSENTKLANNGWLRWHVSDAACKSVKELVPNAPADLVGLIDSMIAKQVSRRPESCAQALNTLGASPQVSIVTGEQIENLNQSSNAGSESMSANAPAAGSRHAEARVTASSPIASTVSSKNTAPTTPTKNTATKPAPRKSSRETWMLLTAVCMLFCAAGGWLIYQNSIPPKPVIQITGSITPADATLMIDGKKVDVANGNWKWLPAAGSPAQIVASREGYEEFRQKLPKVETTKLDIVLEQTPAMLLSGTLIPADTTLTINNEPIPSQDGKWQWKSMKLVEAKASATRAGYKTWENIFSKSGKQEVAVQLELLPKIRLSGSVTPKDAGIVINGAPAKMTDGQWSWTSNDIAPIKINSLKEGFKPFEKTLDATEVAKLMDRDTTIPISLVPIVLTHFFGTIDPPDSKLTINDKPVSIEKDGNWTWETEEEKEVTLTASRSNFASWQMKSPSGERKRIEIVLDPMFTVEPSDAQVFVAGNAIGSKNGAVAFAVPTGKETPITLSANGVSKKFKLKREDLSGHTHRLILPTPPPPIECSPTVDVDKIRQAQSNWADYLDTQSEEMTTIGIKMLLIPPGKLPGSNSDDQTSHFVKTPFRISTSEVTIGQFGKFIAETGYTTESQQMGAGYGTDAASGILQKRHKQFSWKNIGIDTTDNYPVVNVTWNDANAFCEWLSKSQQSSFRLPTDDEWELACRAGAATNYWFGDVCDGHQANVLGNVVPNGLFLRRLTPVASYPPNALGLFDTHGNVWEWCGDRASPGYRGGGWFNVPVDCNATVIRKNDASYFSNSLGFRVAQDIKNEE